jgi:hypothetical protein
MFPQFKSRKTRLSGSFRRREKKDETFFLKRQLQVESQLPI